MKLSAFQLKDKKTQHFFTIYSSLKLKETSLDNILVDHTPSLVGMFSESKLIIKFIRARSWHEYIKLLWNHSRVTKEVKGSQLLSQLGLTVPQIFEVGYGVIPSTKHEFLGYYIMENLTQAGFQELSQLIKEGLLEKDMRQEIMLKIYKGLKVMRDNQIVFSDFHLDNVFANKQGDITWIDTGVTTYSKFSNKKFHAKHKHAINRFINYEYAGQQLLSQSEKSMFKDLLSFAT